MDLTQLQKRLQHLENGLVNITKNISKIEALLNEVDKDMGDLKRAIDNKTKDLDPRSCVGGFIRVGKVDGSDKSAD